MRILIILLVLLAPVALATSWRTLPSAGDHLAREETSMAYCGGTSLCLLGGRNQVRTPVLDTATLTWTNGPAPPIEMHHFQAVTGPDDCAWIIGAWTGRFPGEQAVKDIYRYCASNNKWELMGSIDRPRGAGAVVYHGGYFYLVTGNVGGHQLSAETKVWFDRYDPKSKKWTIMPDIPHPRDHVNAVVADNKMYVASGRDSGAANFPDFFLLVEKKVDVFDFATNTWSTLASDFPRPRAGAPAVVYRGRPMVGGGEGSGRAWEEVDVLSGSRYVPFKDMPRPRHGFGMVACNDVIWVAGGAGTQGGGRSVTVLDAFFHGATPKPCRGVKLSTGPIAKPSKTVTPISAPKTSSTGTNTTSTNTTNTDTTNTGTTNIGTTNTGTADTGITDTGTTGTANPTSSGPTTGGTPNEGEGAKKAAESPRAATQRPDCFPGHAVVHLADGFTKFMKDVQIGDQVLVAPGEYSKVYFFSHQHAEHITEFVHLQTSVDSIALQLSPRHKLYANGKLIEAQHVRIGDEVSIAHDERTAAITSVSRMTAKGLFNPHTLHGDIVVNRVVTSTFTGSVHPTVARVLLQPFSAFYRVFGGHPAVHAVNRGVLRALDTFYW